MVMGGHRFHWTVAQEDVFRWRGSNFMIISSYEPLGKKKNRAINKGAPPEIGGGGGLQPRHCWTLLPERSVLRFHCTAHNYNIDNRNPYSLSTHTYIVCYYTYGKLNMHQVNPQDWLHVDTQTANPQDH